MRTLLTLCLLTASLQAQQTLRGLVSDATTGEPLSFVYVLLSSDPGRGVLTNERGEYLLGLPDSTATDTLRFSLLGYADLRVPLADLPPGDEPLTVEMTTSFIDLGEVVVISDLGLRALVERAVEAIPRNYGHEDYLLKVYFRKHDIDDGDYSQVTEAMLSVRDGVYEEEPQLARTWINEYRSTPYSGPEFNFFWRQINRQGNLIGPYEGPANFARSGKYAWLSGSFFSSLEARDSFIINREKDRRLWPHLTFANRGEYLSGPDTLVSIHYQTDPSIPGISKTSSNAGWNRGELLINKSDLAILRHRHGDREMGSYRETTYQKIGGRYYPRSLQHIIQYDYAAGVRHHFTHRYLYVTEVITDPRAIRQSPKGKRLRHGDPAADITVPYRTAFWEENQVLQSVPAPEAMQRALEQIDDLEEAFREGTRRVRE